MPRKRGTYNFRLLANMVDKSLFVLGLVLVASVAARVSDARSLTGPKCGFHAGPCCWRKMCYNGLVCDYGK